MRKTLTGTVLSNKMDKTIVVGVDTIKKDRIYGKRRRMQKKYYVHDEANQAQIGDTVEIRESRPLSKKKRWVLVEKKE